MFRDVRAEQSQVVDPVIAATDRLITQLQEDLIHERSVVASLLEELRLARVPEAGQMPYEDIDSLVPLQRKSQLLSSMKSRAAQILLAKRMEKESS